MRAKAWYNHLQHFYERKRNADCRQKAILPPKGKNSPFRK